MKRCMRVMSGIGVLLALGVSNVIGCSETLREDGTDRQSTGTMAIGLRTRAASGNVYRLRNAFFEIRDRRTGAFAGFLSSEEDPDALEISTILDRGEYTITLDQGWFLEIVRSGSSGTGGSGGVLGTGGAPGKASGGGFTKGGGTSPPTGGFFGGGGSSGFGGEDSIENESGAGGGGGTTGGFGGSPDPGPGPGGAGGSDPGPGPDPFPGGSGQPVEAFLLSDAVQFVSIFGGDEQFVSYLFQVGGEVIDFNRGRLNVGIDVIEVEPPCVVPEGVLNPQRTLLENSLDATQFVALRDVFTALAENEGHGADPELLYQQIIDSYATEDNAFVEGAAHCGDETTNGQPSLNGFPISCDRVEHGQFNNLDQWFATAFVNRLDLAPQNGAHCGQQRMVFANPGVGRIFMILETQIPNPAPELGIQGCAPLAQFWLDQNEIDDPVERGLRLRSAFLTGSPDLADAGFGPFYSPSNLTIGSGQIRTNNFNQDPWTLREFKLAVDGQELTVLPFPVAESPNGQLWNDDNPLPQGPACRENFLNAIDGLLTDDPAQMSFVVNHECKDSESRNDGSEAYAFQMSSGFEQVLDERLEGTGLTGFDIANRAHFAGSCIGCHVENNGADLGNGVSSPFSLGFVHIAEDPSEQCGEGDSPCFFTSEALNNTFLPQRMGVLVNLLGIDPVPNPCEGGGGNGGSGGDSGFPFPPSTAGVFSGTGGTNSGGESGDGNGVGGSEPSEPAPVIEVELPQASTPIEELQEQDEDIRVDYGDLTLGNRSAQVTH
jgi:hypothetical protein